MASGSIKISGTITGLPSGQEHIELSIAFSAAIGQDQVLDLVLGANTVTVPTGSTMAIFIPPTSNSAVALTLKGVAGDTGITLGRGIPTLVALNSVASFVINAGNALSGCRVVFL